MKKYECKTCNDGAFIKSLKESLGSLLKHCPTCGEEIIEKNKFEIVYEEHHGETYSGIVLEKRKIVNEDEFKLIKLIERIGNSPDGLYDVQLKEVVEATPILMDMKYPEEGETPALISHYYNKNFRVSDKTESFPFAEIIFKSFREGVL